MTIADAGSEFIELMFPRYINQKKRIATSWSRMVVSILTGDLEILFDFCEELIRATLWRLKILIVYHKEHLTKYWEKSLKSSQIS
jgi:hypothetical protein